MCTTVNYHQIGVYKPICPAGARFGFESFYSPGLAEICRGINEGIIKEPSEMLLKSVYACTSCGACATICRDFTKYGADAENLVFMFEDLRAHLVEQGWGPMPIHVKIRDSIAQNHNPYHEDHGKRFSWLNDGVDGGSDLVYFAGCTASYRQQQIAKATVKTLKAAGVKFSILGSEEWCCGSPLLRTGQRKLVKELVEHNIKAIRDKGAKRLVTSCAGCYMTIKGDYEKIHGGPLGFEIIHTVQLLDNMVKEGKLKLKPLHTTVTYHDPCHIGRRFSREKEQIYDEPRRLLQSIPDLKLVEMVRSRDNSWCCGAGGGVKSAFPDYAVWSSTERIKDVDETGAEKIITACPFCVYNLTDGVKEAKKNYEVLDIVNLIERAL